MTDPWQDIANLLDRLLPVDTVVRVREHYVRGVESARSEYETLVKLHREWVEARKESNMWRTETKRLDIAERALAQWEAR